MKALNDFEAYNDSLAVHFAAVHYFTVFASVRGPYESLKSMGFESISNKSLRFRIIDLYDQWYSILLKNESILVDDIHELKRNFHPDHFDKFLVVIPQDPWYGGEMIPVDFRQLKSNQQYKYHIRSLHAGHSHYNSLNSFMANKVESLINSCQKEVERLK